MRALTKYVLFMLVVVTGWSFGQPPAEKPKADKRDTPAANRSLEEALAKALQHSPEVQVAEAKVREAEAELRRTRLALIQRVIEAHSAVDASKVKVAQAEASLVRIQALVNQGAVSSEERQAAENHLAAAKAQLAQTEASLNALTGTLAGVISGVMRAPGGDAAGGASAPLGVFGGLGGRASGTGGFLGGINGGIGGIYGFSGIGGGIGGISGGVQGGIGGGGIGFATEGPARAPRGPIAERIRKALDTPIGLKEFKDVPLGDVVAFFRDAAAGVPFLAHLGDKAKEPVSVALKGEVALGAALQALQDVVPGLQCYVREYGILVTLDDAAPQDGMSMIDFWHKKPDTTNPKSPAK
jgi:hypothetical protein